MRREIHFSWDNQNKFKIHIWLTEQTKTIVWGYTNVNASADKTGVTGNSITLTIAWRPHELAENL